MKSKEAECANLIQNLRINLKFLWMLTVILQVMNVKLSQCSFWRTQTTTCWGEWVFRYVKATKIRWVLEAHHGGDSVRVVCHCISQHPLISSYLTPSRKRERDFTAPCSWMRKGHHWLFILHLLPRMLFCVPLGNGEGWGSGASRSQLHKSNVLCAFGAELWRVCYFENAPPGNNMHLVPVCSVHWKNMP